MKGHGEKLSRKSEQFLAALLSEPTLEAAAKAAGISYSSARRWLHDEGFVAGYRQERREQMQHALGRLSAASAQAVECLVWLLSNAETESVRLGSCRAVLEMALRSAEINDIEERIEKLERLAKGGWSEHDQPSPAAPGAARVVNGRA